MKSWRLMSTIRKVLYFIYFIVINYIESRMKYIAPNVSALVGTQVASKLMAAAGGVDKLANMPACNI